MFGMEEVIYGVLYTVIAITISKIIYRFELWVYESNSKMGIFRPKPTQEISLTFGLFWPLTLLPVSVIMLIFYLNCHREK